MSSKTPSEIVAALADTYTCGHCHSKIGPLDEVIPGFFRLEVRHADGCPVRTGALPDFPDLARAIDRAS